MESQIMKKIYIATSSFNRDLINGLNYIIEFNNLGRTLSEDEMVELIDPDIDGIIAGTELYNARILNHFTKLKCISRCGSGTDNIDLELVNTKDIIVRTRPKAPVKAVAELTLALYT